MQDQMVGALEANLDIFIKFINVFIKVLTFLILSWFLIPVNVQDMATLFQASLYGRFIEIKRSLKRKKVQGMSWGSKIFGCSFNNIDNKRTPIQFRKERQY